MIDLSDIAAVSPLFARFSPTELMRLGEVAKPVRFAARSRLFNEGEPARGCWLIHDGRVALDVTVLGRGQVVVQTLGRGELLGWSWLVPPYRWHLGATAVTDTTATEFDAGQLRALSEQDPRFGYVLTLALFGAVLERLEATRARLLDLYRSPRG